MNFKKQKTRIYFHFITSYSCLFNIILIMLTSCYRIPFILESCRTGGKNITFANLEHSMFQWCQVLSGDRMESVFRAFIYLLIHLTHIFWVPDICQVLFLEVLTWRVKYLPHYRGEHHGKLTSGLRGPCFQTKEHSGDSHVNMVPRALLSMGWGGESR